MAGRQSKISKHLECPVCLDIFQDPRLLPCEAGGHTVCKGCIDDLVKGASLTCPVCRAMHDVPGGGTGKFPRNMVVAGMVDAMCPVCRKREPAVMCTHCDTILCETCQASHAIFTGAQSSLQELGVTLDQAEHETTDAAIDSLTLEVEKEVDIAIDPLAKKLEERRQTLKMELKSMINGFVNSRKPWKHQLKTFMDQAKRYLQDRMRELGDEYSDHITDEKLGEIKTQSQQKITEIKQQLTQSPAILKPVLRFDNREASAAISSLGCIDNPTILSGMRNPTKSSRPTTTQPGGSTEPDSSGSTKPDSGGSTLSQSKQQTVVRPKLPPVRSARPRVAGKKGRGPGE